MSTASGNMSNKISWYRSMCAKVDNESKDFAEERKSRDPENKPKHAVKVEGKGPIVEHKNKQVKE